MVHIDAHFVPCLIPVNATEGIQLWESLPTRLVTVNSSGRSNITTASFYHNHHSAVNQSVKSIKQGQAMLNSFYRLSIWQVRKQKHNLESCVIIECILYSCKLKKQRRAKREQQIRLALFHQLQFSLFPNGRVVPPLIGCSECVCLYFFFSAAKPLFHWLALWWIHCCALTHQHTNCSFFVMRYALLLVHRLRI